jgi:predicted Zn-dependent protease with MMP-like domain
MERSSAEYIAVAYSGQSRMTATQDAMDDLTVLFRALATEIVAAVTDNPTDLDNALIDLENSAKQTFHGMRHPE